MTFLPGNTSQLASFKFTPSAHCTSAHSQQRLSHDCCVVPTTLHPISNVNGDRRVTGSVRVNGLDRRRGHFNRVSAYVAQARCLKAL
eukprot:1782001-Amphidinium_carterae.1